MSYTFTAILMDGDHAYDQVTHTVEGDTAPERLRRPVELDGRPVWALYELVGDKSAPTFEYLLTGYSDRDDTP